MRKKRRRERHRERERERERERLRKRERGKGGNRCAARGQDRRRATGIRKDEGRRQCHKEATVGEHRGGRGRDEGRETLLQGGIRHFRPLVYYSCSKYYQFRMGGCGEAGSLGLRTRSSVVSLLTSHCRSSSYVWSRNLKGGCWVQGPGYGPTRAHNTTFKFDHGQLESHCSIPNHP